MTFTVTNTEPNDARITRLWLQHLETSIDTYNELREQIRKACKADSSLMGADAWLVNAMGTSDMTLGFTPDGIECYGSAYTMQTMEHERFSFLVPWSVLQ